MPTYSFRCDDCSVLETIDGELRTGPTGLTCAFCGRPMKRDYKADNIAIAAVPQSTYIPALGTNISDNRQVDEHLKRLTEESFDRVGYEPKLRARHPSELAAEHEAHKDVESDASKNRKRITQERAAQG